MARLFLLLLLSSQLSGCAGLFIAGTAGTALVLHDRRDFSVQVDDTKIQMTAHSRMAEHGGLGNQSRVRVFSVNGQVLLVGQTPSDHLKQEAEKIIGKIEGVSRVYNELVIAEPISLGTRSEDTWLSSKVRMALFGDDELDSTRIKVVTENSEVYLLGMVTTQEAGMATEITRNVTGVSGVIKVFQFIED